MASTLGGGRAAINRADRKDGPGGGPVSRVDQGTGASPVGGTRPRALPQITELHVRHRGAFTYVDASLTDGAELRLCRLRYVGSAHDWRVAIYRASHDDYAESVFPTGLPIGTCQDALGLACGLYLDDPTAWHDLRPPTN